jgi:hypothetical protein
MVVIDVDESLSVTLTMGTSKPCSYTVVYEDEEVTQYETSADPRTAGGRVGLRNVICNRVPDRDKTVIDEKLSAEISEHAEALAEEFGPR